MFSRITHSVHKHLYYVLFLTELFANLKIKKKSNDGNTLKMKNGFNLKFVLISTVECGMLSKFGELFFKKKKNRKTKDRRDDA